MKERGLATQPDPAGPTDLRRLYDEAVDAGSLDAYRKRRWGRMAEFAS